MEQKQFFPDLVNTRAGDGLTVITNPGKEAKVFLSSEWGFRYNALLIFDRNGTLCEIGGYLLANEDTKNGSTQDSVRIPAGGFLAAFGKNADEWFYRCYHEVMEDAVLYNATLVPDHPCYGSYDEETNCLRISLPETVPDGENAFRVLFLGNSTFYYNGCPLKFKALCRNAGIPVSVRYCTFGSAYLYQFADPETEHGKLFRKLLSEESFDYVVMQDAQAATLQQAADALRTILPMIRENGARPILLNRYYPSADPDVYASKAPVMDKLYRDLSELFRIPAAPAGPAFTLCRANAPEIDLYAGDRSHHSSEGSYLIACVLAGFLFDIPFEDDPYTAFLDEKTARKLQSFAEEAVRKEKSGDLFRYASASQDLEPGSLEGTQEMSLRAAEEGTVLLKNDGALPLKNGANVALFGRMQTEYIKSGTGSGGKVHAPFVPSIRSCLLKEDLVLDRTVMDIYDDWIEANPIDRGDGWSCPWNQEEMPLKEADVASASDRNETALYIIGRTAGEAKDCSGQPGSFFLTETERNNLVLLSHSFRKVVVLLNIGNQMDLSWSEEIPVSAILCLWQGGMMGGIACAEILTGKANPSGKLADTIARRLEDYPSEGHFGNPDRNEYYEDIYVGYRYFETFGKDKVLFPFGFGLSYTEFETVVDTCAFDGSLAVASVWVTNTGSLPGKQVVQWYLSAPQNGIGNPARRLIGFAKTELLQPGESCQLTMHASVGDFASYDDHRHCWLLEEGEYVFYIGSDVRSAEEAGRFSQPERVLRRCKQLLAPEKPFRRMTFSGTEDAPARKETARPSIPACKPYAGDKGIKLWDVADGKASMDDFLSQIPDDQLMCIVRGEGMNSPKVTAGSAGACGGVTRKLLDLGIPILCCADGPSGVRLAGDVIWEPGEDGVRERIGSIATAMPNGTLLACTWNTDLIRDLYFYEGIEIRLYNIDTILGPGINIHRHPLCGRNFEYFSECPVLTGKMTAAVLQGLDRAGIAGTIKHFFGNSQETNRVACDAVMSERAAREIYVKAFEIAVKEGGCRSIMTSYNPVNGFWSASNPELTALLLREEWGFDGLVMTDWWANVNSDEKGVPDHESLQRMVHAQNDVFMLSPDAETRQDRMPESLRNGTLTRDELAVCAGHICNFAMKTPAFLRMRSGEKPLNERAVSAEGMEAFWSVEKPKPSAEYSVSGPTGLCVAELVLEGKNTGDLMAQRTLSMRIDGANAFSVTVSPSEGRQTVLRGFTMISGVRKMSFSYSGEEIDLVSVRMLADGKANGGN